MRKYYLTIAILSVLVLSVVVYSFVITGSPFQQKNRTLDQNRLSQFSSIRYAIETYYRTNGKLPSQLSDLERMEKYKDPKTGKAYDYKIVSATAYQLCTEFATDTTRSSDFDQTDIYSEYLGTSTKHKKGYDCITQTLPSHVANPVNSAGSTEVGWYKYKTTIIANFDTALATQDEKRMLVKDNNTIRIIIYNDAEILNSKGEKVDVSQFVSTDRLVVDVSEQKGTMYKATRIQNTSR